MNEIPLIDLSDVRNGATGAEQRVAGAIDRACKDIGFFTVRGHGIDTNVFRDVYATSQTFFELPLETKNSCRLSTGFTLTDDEATPYGYSGLLEENAYAYMGEFGKPADYVEKFSVGRLVLDDKEQLPFPKRGDTAVFRRALKDYFAACEKLSADLSELFTVALDLPRDFFAKRANRSDDSVRVHHYPGFSTDFGNDQGMAEHTDGTLMTLLTHTASGIEVKNRRGDWITPEMPSTDCFLVNIGDLMMRWSNDEYVSTRHRVVLRNHSRQSIVFFKLANDETIIESFPKFCRDRPSKYQPVVYKEFSLEKMDALFSRQKQSQEVATA